MFFIKMAGSKQVYAEDIRTELMSPLPKACVYLKNTTKLIFQLFKSSKLKCVCISMFLRIENAPLIVFL